MSNRFSQPSWKYVPLGALIFIALLGAVCSRKPEKKISPTVPSAQLNAPLPPVLSPSESKGVKNVIFMIGDGMGVQQVSEAVLYRQLRHSTDPELALEKLLHHEMSGLMRTTSYGDIVTDSAAAATAMACGQKVLNESLGLDANGYPCETVLEKAEKMGKATGLVSTTRITHATPAGFAAHQVYREMENQIAEDIIEKHDVDVMLSGGVAYLIPQFKDEIKKEPMKASDIAECADLDPAIDGKSKREDQKNLIATAKSKGFTFVCKAEQLEQIDLTPDVKILGLFGASVLPMIQERRKIASIPTLARLTKKSLDILDRKKNGFFLMVEGGLIDYAGHDNDAGTMLQETLDFDESVQVALDYVDHHPDSLLIVTADHETGGFGFAYGGHSDFELALPSGLAYHKPYEFAPFTKFDYLIKQNKSFRAILEPIISKLYPKEPDPKSSYTMEMAVKDLIESMKLNTAYTLTEDQARRVLFRKPGAKDASPEDFSEFYVHASIHPDILGREVANQNHVVWAAGTHTSTPVWVMSKGPSRYSERVRGFIDNTEIAKIIEDAFNGR